MVEPSVMKKQRPEPGCMTKEEVYIARRSRGAKDYEQRREDTWDHGRRRGWTVAPGAGPAKGRAKRAEQGHHRRAEDHLSTENYVKFVVLFNIADGFPCFHG